MQYTSRLTNVFNQTRLINSQLSWNGMRKITKTRAFILNISPLYKVESVASLLARTARTSLSSLARGNSCLPACLPCLQARQWFSFMSSSAALNTPKMLDRKELRANSPKNNAIATVSHSLFFQLVLAWENWRTPWFTGLRLKLCACFQSDFLDLQLLCCCCVAFKQGEKQAD